MFKIPLRLLISDANILIDIEIGRLTPAIFHLPYEVTVPDILFESELREQHSHLIAAGLKVKSLTPEFVKKMEFLRKQYPKPSMVDHSVLALAMQEKCLLLTGDKDLRTAAEKESVEVHGTLWVIEQLVSQKIIQLHEARGSFDAMKVGGSRLPWPYAEELLNKWEESSN